MKFYTHNELNSLLVWGVGDIAFTMIVYYEIIFTYFPFNCSKLKDLMVNNTLFWRWETYFLFHLLIWNITIVIGKRHSFSLRGHNIDTGFSLITMLTYGEISHHVYSLCNSINYNLLLASESSDLAKRFSFLKIRFTQF